MNSLSYRLAQGDKYLYRAIQRMAGRVARSAGLLTCHAELSGILIRGGRRRVSLGLLSNRVVTDAGVAFLADDWFDASQDVSNFNYHDSGTGTTAEAASQTDLITPAGPTTRATGTKSNPTAPVVRSVGTISYTGTLAITEHGLFNQAARGGGTVMWDRSVFSAINVVNLDAIQFTYDLTLTAGG